jgi:hypothetical protein
MAADVERFEKKKIAVSALLVGVGGGNRSARVAHDQTGEFGPISPVCDKHQSSMDISISIHSETTAFLHNMELVYQSMLSYQPITSSPPILDCSVDATFDNDSQHLSGLRPFLEAVKRDIDVIKQVPLYAYSDQPSESLPICVPQ